MRNISDLVLEEWSGNPLAEQALQFTIVTTTFKRTELRRTLPMSTMLILSVGDPGLTMDPPRCHYRSIYQRDVIQEWYEDRV